MVSVVVMMIVDIGANAAGGFEPPDVLRCCVGGLSI